MVMKTVETKVDFPECTVCGNGIFEGEKCFDIRIMLSRRTVDHRGGSQGPSTGNSGNPLLLCDNCFSNNEMDPIVKLRIIQELERQKKELDLKKESRQ